MMTPDELYAKGYALEYSMWGVYVFYQPKSVNPTDNTDDEVRFTVQFDHPLLPEEAQRRGWEAAQADFVKRRLAQ